jgi:hypothetical protein
MPSWTRLERRTARRAGTHGPRPRGNRRRSADGPMGPAAASSRTSSRSPSRMNAIRSGVKLESSPFCHAQRARRPPGLQQLLAAELGALGSLLACVRVDESGRLRDDDQLAARLPPGPVEPHLSPIRTDGTSVAASKKRCNARRLRVRPGCVGNRPSLLRGDRPPSFAGTIRGVAPPRRIPPRFPPWQSLGVSGRPSRLPAGRNVRP